MSDINPVHLTNGPPETVLPSEPADALAALEAALNAPADQRRIEVGKVVCSWPTFLAGWASMGDLASDDAEAYAAPFAGSGRRKRNLAGGDLELDEPSSRRPRSVRGNSSSVPGAEARQISEARACWIPNFGGDPSKRSGTPTDHAMAYAPARLLKTPRRAMAKTFAVKANVRDGLRARCRAENGFGPFELRRPA